MDMLSYARDLGISNGCAGVVSIEFNIMRFEQLGPNGWRDPNPKRSDGDLGTNYIGFGFGKGAQSFRTRLPSSADNAMKGESPAEGCVLSKNEMVLFYFSGGTETQDLQVVNKAKIHYDNL